MKKTLLMAFLSLSLYGAENIITEEAIDCENGTKGFLVKVSNPSVNSEVSYNSCEDTNITVSKKAQLPKYKSSGVRVEHIEALSNEKISGYENTWTQTTLLDMFVGRGYHMATREGAFENIVHFERPIHVGDFTTTYHKTVSNAGTDRFNLYKSDDGENWELAYSNEERLNRDYVHKMDFVTSYLKIEGINDRLSSGGHWRIQGVDWEITEVEEN